MYVLRSTCDESGFQGDVVGRFDDIWLSHVRCYANYTFTHVHILFMAHTHTHTDPRYPIEIKLGNDMCVCTIR